MARASSSLCMSECPLAHSFPGRHRCPPLSGVRVDCTVSPFGQESILPVCQVCNHHRRLPLPHPREARDGIGTSQTWAPSVFSLATTSRLSPLVSHKSWQCAQDGHWSSSQCTSSSQGCCQLVGSTRQRSRRSGGALPMCMVSPLRSSTRSWVLWG